MRQADLVIGQISIPLNAAICEYFRCSSESVNWCKQLFHGVEGVKLTYQLSMVSSPVLGNGVLSVLCCNSYYRNSIRSQTIMLSTVTCLNYLNFVTLFIDKNE